MEMVSELVVLIACTDVAEATEVSLNIVSLNDTIEAIRHMIMNWYQTQIPDPHAVSDLNKI
jgi:hypothetical protein